MTARTESHLPEHAYGAAGEGQQGMPEGGPA